MGIQPSNDLSTPSAEASDFLSLETSIFRDRYVGNIPKDPLNGSQALTVSRGQVSQFFLAS